MEERRVKIGYIVNYVFCGLIVVAALFFMLLHKTVSSYIVKTIPSVLFLIVGVFNYLYCTKILKCNDGSKKYSLILLSGLFFAMLGDIFLIDFFEIGAILFAIGHILFFIAFCHIGKLNLQDGMIGLLIFGLALLFIWLYPYFDFQGMGALIVVYALIISFMLGKAIGNLFTYKSLLRSIVLLGAGLFFFSDFMLVLFRFAHKAMVLDWLCVMTYYPAEFLLGFSIFISFVCGDKNKVLKNGKTENN